MPEIRPGSSKVVFCSSSPRPPFPSHSLTVHAPRYARPTLQLRSTARVTSRVASYANGLVAPVVPHVHGAHPIAGLCGDLARDARCGLRLRLRLRPRPRQQGRPDGDARPRGTFHQACFETPDLDQTGNSLKILNIEHIRDYHKARVDWPLSASNVYRTNLGYGIGPHYGSALRGFGLIDVNADPSSRTNSTPRYYLRKGIARRLRTSPDGGW